MCRLVTTVAVMAVLLAGCGGEGKPTAPRTGACCAFDGACTLTTLEGCADTWIQAGVCGPNPCPPTPTGSCCAPDGSCTVSPASQCAGGLWTADLACLPNTCARPTGACCHPDGTCTVILEADCTGPWAMSGTCVPNDCPQPTGACCSRRNSCTVTTQTACSGEWTPNGVCTPNPCLPPPTTGTITGVAALTPGQSADLGNSRVAIYASPDDWASGVVMRQQFLRGSGARISFGINDVPPGTYYLDVWKDVNGDAYFDFGDLYGVHGKVQWPMITLTPIAVIAGEISPAAVLVYAVLDRARSLSPVVPARSPGSGSVLAPGRIGGVQRASGLATGRARVAPIAP